MKKFIYFLIFFDIFFFAANYSLIFSLTKWENGIKICEVNMWAQVLSKKKKQQTFGKAGHISDIHYIW